MTINPDAVGATTGVGDARWTSRDCMLYALGVGANASDPLDRSELKFTTENSDGIELEVLPTFALTVPAGRGTPLDALGDIDRRKMVNAEQRLVVHRPIPTDGHVEGESRVTAIYDKGSGALVMVEIDAVDVGTRQPMWTMRTGLFLRGEGGWGGDRGPSSVGSSIPERSPDHVVTYETRLDQALLYRLMGDHTPLHSDPAFADKAGFARPILHGKCTLGFTGRALLHAVCGSDPSRFRSIEGRFSKPVTPGETLTVSIWIIGDGEAVFRTETSPGTVVVDAGHCAFAG